MQELLLREGGEVVNMGSERQAWEDLVDMAQKRNPNVGWVRVTAWSVERLLRERATKASKKTSSRGQEPLMLMGGGNGPGPEAASLPHRPKEVRVETSLSSLCSGLRSVGGRWCRRVEGLSQLLGMARLLPAKVLSSSSFPQL